MASLRRKEETKTRLVYTAQAELTHGFLSLATLNGGTRKVKAETLLALLLKVTEATPSRAWPAPTATGQPAGEGWEGADKHVIVPPSREEERWPRHADGSGQDGFSGTKNSPLALSRAAGCGTGKKGQAV